MPIAIDRSRSTTRVAQEAEEAEVGRADWEPSEEEAPEAAREADPELPPVRLAAEQAR